MREYRKVFVCSSQIPYEIYESLWHIRSNTGRLREFFREGRGQSYSFFSIIVHISEQAKKKVIFSYFQFMSIVNYFFSIQLE